jgi:sugar phosphate isomerase/epimerase
MIYISSFSVKNKMMKDIIEIFIKNGIKNIELSGGTDWYKDIYNDIFTLKKKFSLNLLIHNYFPPPKEHFVLNLASYDNKIWSKTLEHYRNSIKLAIDLGCPVYGLHAGFFVDPAINEIGKTFEVYKPFEKETSVKKFIEGYNILNNLFGNTIRLYIENNVISENNFLNYGINPFMLTCFDEYDELKKQLDFNLLLDLGHLMVSANTLKLDFYHEIGKLINKTDYIHFSGNDFKEDQNIIPGKDSFIYKLLKANYAETHFITLEVYDPEMGKIIDFYKEVEKWT